MGDGHSGLPYRPTELKHGQWIINRCRCLCARPHGLSTALQSAHNTQAVSQEEYTRTCMWLGCKESQRPGGAQLHGSPAEASHSWTALSNQLLVMKKMSHSILVQKPTATCGWASETWLLWLNDSSRKCHWISLKWVVYKLLKPI